MMDNLNLSNLDCPQYVCFKTEFMNGLESSPSKLSLKDSSMVVDEQDSVSYDVQDQPIPNNLYSPSSEVNSVSNQHSPGGYSLRSNSSLKSYPVIQSQHRSLPGNTSVPGNSKTGKTTKVRAFNIRATPKRKRGDEHIPMAEQVAAFHRKTPQRFHSTGPKAFQPSKHWTPPSVTHPVSPNLHVAKRFRGNHVMSQEEKEAQEVEEMKRYRFRARPIKDGILQRRESLKAVRKPTTKPLDIQLRTAQRAAEAYSATMVEEKPYEFRARPVPTAIFNGPTGLKEKPVASLTEAKTPNFTLKKRAEKWKSRVPVDEAAEPFKAQPIPVFDPFQIKHETKHTDVKPFSFDSKDKNRMMQKEKKIVEEIEKENRVYEFKAQPMPSPAPSVLPAVPKKPPTQPQPFNFHFEEKNSRHNSFDISDQFHRSFKAHPATVLKKPPFLPEKPEKPAIEVKEFHLHTDIRASERLKLKEITAIQEKEKALALQHLKLLQEEEEKREIARLRKEAVHKANPIRLYKPVEIKPSSKPPTEPISPKFKTNGRLQQKLGGTR